MEAEIKLLILGSGCAGHTAAIYGARANLEPVVLEGHEPGGQLSLTSLVENYPGFPEGINGYDLVENMKKQAIHFGAKYIMERVAHADFSSSPFSATSEEGNVFRARSVIIATGARARMLGVPGEKELFGHGGVSSCATCDGAFYREKKVIVIGGGDTAMEDALFLTRFAGEVHIVHRRDKLRASKIMQDRVLQHPKITVHWSTEILEMCAQQGKLNKVKIASHPEGKALERLAGPEAKSVTLGAIECDGAFLAIGHIPNTEFLEGKLPLNDEGYILTTRQHCITSDVYTDIPGVFAAGDVVDWEFQQAVTAAAMGCKAAMAAESFLS